MVDKGFNDLSEMTGKATRKVENWEHLNLHYKIVADIDEKKCIGCQLCYVACEDGAHQAIGLPGNSENRIPYIIEDNCVGCNLCSLVCPVESCITMVRKDDGSNYESWTDYVNTGKAPTEFNDDRAGGKHHQIPKPSEGLNPGV